MRRLLAFVVVVAVVAFSTRARATEAPSPKTPPVHGDLFPGAGRPTVAAASGLPIVAVAEVGIGVTNGFVMGAVAGTSPDVWTAGLRPRMRLPTTERTALVLVSPLLFYPKSENAGTDAVGATPWVLARPELFFDSAIGERWHVAGGMGVIAAASTEALGRLVTGGELALPPYDGATEARRGFAGGVWNTVAARGSYALGPTTHAFAECSIIFKGVALAKEIGAAPVLFNFGLQRGF